MILLGALALLLCGCRSPKTDRAQIVFAVLRGPSALALEKLGGAPGVSFIILDEPLRMRQLMLEGDVDFAVLPTAMAATMYNKGAQYALCAVPLWGSLHLCGRDSTVRSLQDLRGGRLFVPGRGLTAEILFRHLLTANGMDPDKDLELDYRFPGHIALANAAIASKVDFALLPEPFASQVLGADPEMHPLLDISALWAETEGCPLPETALLCRKSLPAENPERFSAIMSACRESERWVLSHPDSAAALAVQMGINPDKTAVENCIPRSNMRFTPAEAAVQDLEHYLKTLYLCEPSSTGGALPDEDWIVK